MVADIFDTDSRFLHYFPGYGFLYLFPLVNESGQGRKRIGARECATRLTEKAPVIVRYHCDYHGICTWIVLSITL